MANKNVYHSVWEDPVHSIPIAFPRKSREFHRNSIMTGFVYASIPVSLSSRKKLYLIISYNDKPYNCAPHKNSVEFVRPYVTFLLLVWMSDILLVLSMSPFFLLQFSLCSLLFTMAWTFFLPTRSCRIQIKKPVAIRFFRLLLSLLSVAVAWDTATFRADVK